METTDFAGDLSVSAVFGGALPNSRPADLGMIVLGSSTDKEFLQAEAEKMRWGPLPTTVIPPPTSRRE